jgi:hypothetical protein
MSLVFSQQKGRNHVQRVEFGRREREQLERRRAGAHEHAHLVHGRRREAVARARVDDHGLEAHAQLRIGRLRVDLDAREAVGVVHLGGRRSGRERSGGAGGWTWRPRCGRRCGRRRCVGGRCGHRWGRRRGVLRGRAGATDRGEKRERPRELHGHAWCGERRMGVWTPTPAARDRSVGRWSGRRLWERGRAAKKRWGR